MALGTSSKLRKAEIVQGKGAGGNKEEVIAFMEYTKNTGLNSFSCKMGFVCPHMSELWVCISLGSEC